MNILTADSRSPRKAIDLIAHPPGASGDPLNQMGTIALKLTQDQQQRGGYISLTPSHYYDPHHFFYALADLATEIGNRGGFNGLPEGPWNAISLEYAPGEDSENSTIALAPVLPSPPAYTIRPDQVERARGYTADARRIMGAKEEVGSFAMKNTTAGNLLLAMEALLDVIYFGKEQAGGQKPVQGTPE